MPETENQVAETAAPGQVIAPGAAPAAAAPVAEAPPAPPETQQSPVPAPQPAPSPVAGSDGTLSWTATEFVSHKKTPAWYALLALAAAILAALVYLLTKDLISTIVVVTGAAVLGVYAARQPGQMQYQMDGGGIMIGNKYHNFDDFRSFAVVPEGGHSSIIFSPLKRFAPLTTIYYNQEDEEAIVNLLADRLPIEEHRHDAIDRLMNRIHF